MKYPKHSPSTGLDRRQWLQLLALSATAWGLSAPVALPAGRYMTEGVTPYGYEHQKEEDKNVDFGDAKAAYAKPAQIKSAYPKTIRVATPGGRDVQYFVERDDKNFLRHSLAHFQSSDAPSRDLPPSSGYSLLASSQIEPPPVSSGEVRRKITAA